MLNCDDDQPTEWPTDRPAKRTDEDKDKAKTKTKRRRNEDEDEDEDEDKDEEGAASRERRAGNGIEGHFFLVSLITAALTPVSGLYLTKFKVGRKRKNDNSDDDNDDNDDDCDHDYHDHDDAAKMKGRRQRASKRPKNTPK